MQSTFEPEHLVFTFRRTDYHDRQGQSISDHTAPALRQWVFRKMLRMAREADANLLWEDIYVDVCRQIADMTTLVTVTSAYKLFPRKDGYLFERDIRLVPQSTIHKMEEVRLEQPFP